MDIFEFAIQMERDGEAFYRNLAEKAEHTGIKRIFTMLAEDEIKHQNAIDALRTASRVDMVSTEILANAKNVFADLSPASWSGETVQIDLYKQAQEIERKSQAFYEEKAATLDEGAAKSLLLQIAEEEKRHYFLLDNLIEFVNRPQSWLENAEFVHLDEY